MAIDSKQSSSDILSITEEIKQIVFSSREKAVRLVDHERSLMYWQIGERIFVREQAEKDRADYGSYLIKMLSEKLEPEFGSGFSRRQMELFRQFYRTFPIANTLYSQLSWSQYKLKQSSQASTSFICLQSSNLLMK